METQAANSMSALYCHGDPVPNNALIRGCGILLPQQTKCIYQTGLFICSGIHRQLLAGE